MRLAIILMALGSLAVPARAIVVGQVDDFQDGTTQGWDFYAPTTNQPNNGPAGAGDKFLQLISDGGSGLSGELRSINSDTRWQGNYLAAGVTAISMDLKAFSGGGPSLEIRLIWSDNNGSWTSTVPCVLPADGQWHTAIFGLTVSDLTPGAIGQNLALSLQNMSGMGFRHQSGPPTTASSATPIADTLNVDNILAVPEPSSLVLFSLCAPLLRGKRQSSCEFSLHA